MKRTLLIALVAASIAGLAVACQKGPAEKAGEKIDHAVEDTKDAARDVKRDLSKP